MRHETILCHPTLPFWYSLDHDTEADLAESWWAGSVDCPAGACLLVEYQVAGGAGAIRSWLQTEEPSGVMDCNDMDLFTNESVYDSIGALDHFAHGVRVGVRHEFDLLGQEEKIWHEEPGTFYFSEENPQQGRFRIARRQ